MLLFQQLHYLRKSYKHKHYFQSYSESNKYPKLLEFTGFKLIMVSPTKSTYIAKAIPKV